MYFPGEAENEGDIIFRGLSADERFATTASILPPTADLEPDSMIARWDIVLLAG
jgi:hypothetical protein